LVAVCHRHVHSRAAAWRLKAHDGGGCRGWLGLNGRAGGTGLNALLLFIALALLGGFVLNLPQQAKCL
jgi:hypothetical protein